MVARSGKSFYMGDQAETLAITKCETRLWLRQRIVSQGAEIIREWLVKQGISSDRIDVIRMGRQQNDP